MDMVSRLSKYFDELVPYFPELSWYGKKADLENIDDEGAILTYTDDISKADTHPHFIMVTLTLYLTNQTEHTYDIARELGYYAVDESTIDEKYNVISAYQKKVVIM